MYARTRVYTRRNGMGLAPAAVIAAAKPVANVLKNIVGGRPKPLLVPEATIRAMLATLNGAERAQMDTILRSFGWYKGNAEAVAGKIAAELRDAKQPNEVALYNFVDARVGVGAPPPAQPTFLQELAQDAGAILTRRAAQEPAVQNIAGNIVTERTRDATRVAGPALFALGGLALVLAMRGGKRRNG